MIFRFADGCLTARLTRHWCCSLDSNQVPPIYSQLLYPDSTACMVASAGVAPTTSRFSGGRSTVELQSRYDILSGNFYIRQYTFLLPLKVYRKTNPFCAIMQTLWLLGLHGENPTPIRYVRNRTVYMNFRYVQVIVAFFAVSLKLLPH